MKSTAKKNSAVHRYTAQEMRVRANYLEVALADAKTAAMLRQAADMMEREESREKNYEFVVKFFRKRSDKCIGRSADHYDSLDCARSRHRPDTNGELVKFFRRSVGEWEEVKE